VSKTFPAKLNYFRFFVTVGTCIFTGWFCWSTSPNKPALNSIKTSLEMKSSLRWASASVGLGYKDHLHNFLLPQP